VAGATSRRDVVVKDPRNPTKAYLAGVLRSEGLVANDEAVALCRLGWLEAVGDPGRLERARELQRAFDRGDLWAIGFCTYAYGYGANPKPPPPGEEGEKR
jgi:hypothetical protein